MSRDFLEEETSPSCLLDAPISNIDGGINHAEIPMPRRVLSDGRYKPICKGENTLKITFNFVCRPVGRWL